MNKKQATRKLYSGRTVKEEPKSVVVIDSKCPEKWVCVDLETTDTWIMENGHHRRPNAIEVKEAIKILKNPR